MNASGFIGFVQYFKNRNANGNTPRINAIEVIMMGRKRSLTASMVAVNNGVTLSDFSFANATINIAFFAARPIKVINPIWAYMLFDNDLISVSAVMAPNAPMGTANKTAKGTDQVDLWISVGQL
jgi:hypothetical protein